MVPTGIWRDVWIEECGGITIENIRLIPEIREKGGKLTVHADTRSAGRVTGKYELSVEVYDGPVQIGCVRDGFDLRNGINHAEEQIYIDRIEKWYPNGCGGQKLYDVTAGAAGRDFVLLSLFPMMAPQRKLCPTVYTLMTEGCI